jgi:hypothetical protein
MLREYTQHDGDLRALGGSRIVAVYLAPDIGGKMLCGVPLSMTVCYDEPDPKLRSSNWYPHDSGHWLKSRDTGLVKDFLSSGVKFRARTSEFSVPGVRCSLTTE